MNDAVKKFRRSKNRSHVLLCLLVVSWCCQWPLAGVVHADDGDTIVVTAEEIRAMQALKMADVLNHLPGIKAGDSSVNIHGSSKVKVFVDGRPINDPTSSHGAVNWEVVSPDEVARIEILRGKGGLTYGQDASGGVILITTRKDDRLSGNVRAYGGNYDTGYLNAGVTATSGKLNSGVSAGFETSDGYKTNNDKERCQAGLKFDYAVDDRKNYGFSMDYVQEERGSSGLPAYPTPEYRKTANNTALALRAELGRWDSRTTYNAGYNHNTDPSRDLDKTLRVTKWGQHLSTTFSTLDRDDLSCGLELNWNTASGTGFEDQGESAASLFAAQTFSFAKTPVSLTLGLRGNTHDTFGSTIDPELKTTYKRKAWRLTAAYSRTENIPSFYQRYNETSSTRPNPDLEMEQADNLSLALFATPCDTFSFSVTGFYNLLRDRITYVSGADGMGQYQNVGEVSYAGADAALNWKLHAAFTAKGSYTYLEAKDLDSGLWLTAKARHVANLSLFWRPSKSFSLVTLGKYTSEVYRNTANTLSVPEYTLFEVRAEYAFKHVALFTEITNATNITYYYADGLLGPPRMWVVGINWRI